MLVPGTDGEKMSKSRDNIINLFLDDKRLRKQIMKIQTDSTPLEKPKNPDTCNLFALYKLVASDSQVSEMRNNYLAGNYGYGHAKQAFFELLIIKFAKERELYNHYMNNLQEVDDALAIGAKKAKKVANEVLNRVRAKLGY
jgi:tryptophanyl-tRNA synthetase